MFALTRPRFGLERLREALTSGFASRPRHEKANPAELRVGADDPGLPGRSEL
jgi:hypothetical protein